MPASLRYGTILLVAAAAFCAEEPAPNTTPPASPPTESEAASEPGALDRLFNRKLPDAIGKSKISINARLRWEWADQETIGGVPDPEDANAFTLRTRFGLTSGTLYGFQGMIEGENIAVLGPTHNYNAAGSNRNEQDRTIIADPPTTELNQAWISYSNWNTTAKLGRQRIALDNLRFVGEVGWRQNMQTFDAVSVENRCLDRLRLFYGYLWAVNRVFGDVGGLPPALQDFDSDSHLINLSYAPCPHAKLTAYSYLLDLENAAPAARANSTATYGAQCAGHVDLVKEAGLEYRAEFAWQTDYANSPVDYLAEYYNVELGLNIRPVLVGGGYEVLGTDNNQGFKTPLATLHAFNGWADVFLNTPTKGLRDLYAFAQTTLPANIPIRFVYHKFNADSGGGDFGQEFDLQVMRKFGRHWTGLAKYAHYEAADTPPFDVDKFWLQLEFNF